MKKLILTIFISMFCIGLFAQPIPPPVSHGSTGDQQGAPIDGGLSILMLIGAAYGAKKAYNFKEKEKMMKD